MDSIVSTAAAAKPGDPRPNGAVQTLDRIVAVIEAVADAGACSLADLVRVTGLARPTAHRLAVACEAHGLLHRDGAGRFRLGGRLVGWGAQAARTNPLVEAARPVLETLVAETGESAQLYVREGDHRVCVATHERASGLRDTVPLGARMPLSKGSGGKVLLAWAPDGARFDIAPAVLEAVRGQGYAESNGEREPGVASVSAPVRDDGGGVVAAISVSGPAERMDRAALDRARAALGAAAGIRGARGGVDTRLPGVTSE
jgi:DNA-binding IclR family transcriptional regulator